jgi:hypothetical protein
MFLSETVIRAMFLSIGGVAVFALAYVLLFVEGDSHGMSFLMKNVFVDFMFCKPGMVRPERLEYLVFIDGLADVRERPLSYGKHQFTLAYRDGNSLAFTLRPGQTAWVGGDRQPHITWTKWTLDEIASLRRLSISTNEMRFSSLDDLRMATTALKAEPDGAANRSQPIRPETNPNSSAAGSRR